MVVQRLGLLVFVSGGCNSSSSDAADCPPSPNFAFIQLGCLPIEPPSVKTTGPCSVCPVALANGSIPEGSTCAASDNSQDIALQGNDAGTCRVALTFGNGATSSVDVDFMSMWRPLGPTLTAADKNSSQRLPGVGSRPDVRRRARRRAFGLGSGASRRPAQRSGLLAELFMGLLAASSACGSVEAVA
jgi:hypothetical protein